MFSFEWSAGAYTHAGSVDPTVGEVLSAFDWGYTGDMARGRVFILHDYNGARIACAVIAEDTVSTGSYGLASINTYPDYDDEYTPQGSVALSIVGTKAYITYDLV